MLGRNSAEKQMVNMQRQQLIQADEQADLQQSQSFDPQSFGVDSQVSALILESERRFLKYYRNKEGYNYLAEEDVGFIEPYGDEPRSFADVNKDLPLLEDMGAGLSEIYIYGEKYGKDIRVKRLFNSICRPRNDKLTITRTTGKPGKLAKSQFVGQDSFVRREQGPVKKEKFLGLF